MKKIIYLFIAFFLTSFSALAQNKYAVLIIGDCQDRGNHVPITDKWNGGYDYGPQTPNRFWNDTYLMWEMLQSKGFSRENIFVLFDDGLDLRPDNPRYRPPTGVTIVNDRADLATVTSLFEGLQNGSNGMPTVTENDFLFVWIYDHGGFTGEHSYIHLINGQIIHDVTFASLVNQIPAYRKAFWMQQCHAGGFADDLSSPNTVFISASQAEQMANDADNKTPRHTDFVEKEPYNGNNFIHGEFNFHLISVVNQESPTYQQHYDGEPYSNGNTDRDSFISMNEAYQWLINHSSRTTEAGIYGEDDLLEDPVYDDIGGIGNHMSFEYPTLLFDEITHDETYRGIIGISKDLVVVSGQTLTFTGTSHVTLCNSARLIIEEGASLVIDGDVCFQGTDDNILSIHGSLVQNMGSDLKFYDMQVVSDAAELFIEGARFANTELNYCPSGSSAIEEVPRVGNVVVSNCQFHNPSKRFAIHVENSRDFNICGNLVSSSGLNGIIIMNSGNIAGSNSLIRKVRNNDISGCSAAGLMFYASSGTIAMNNIHGNGIGVKLLNNSNVLNFSGDCSAMTMSQTQYIHDNQSYEIYMTTSCNPQSMRYNSIRKENAGGTPYICYDNIVDISQEQRGFIDISNNEWGYHFVPSLHLYNTTASAGFEYLPYWRFSDCSEGQHPGQRRLALADSLCKIGEYEAAKATYLQLIEDNLNTVSAESALKSLLPLESHVGGNYEGLRQYYLTDAGIASEEALSVLASWLANRCDEILANYDEAVAWYEEVITNPETSYADSVFATIDLGNLYLEMERLGIKAVGKLTQFKPESKCVFKKQSHHALSLLPIQKESNLLVPKADPLPYWTDTITTQPEGYATDADGNVEISSSSGLVWLVSVVNGLNGCSPNDFEGRTVKLANDIDFGENGLNYNFTPIGTRQTPFLGTFDGNGHKIHKLRLRYNGYDSISYDFDMGIFGYIRHATIKNVTIDSTCSMGSSCQQEDYYRGGLVGFSDSLSLVENCHIHCWRIGFWYGSSLVGLNRNSVVRNCSFGGGRYMSAPAVVGGSLVGFNRCEGGYADAVVENCYFHGRLSLSISARRIGGLVGFNETEPNENGRRAVVRNCHSTPTDSFIALRYGALAAVNKEESLIQNCYADIRKMYQNNNMVGENHGEMTDCLTYTNIDGVGTLSQPVTLNGNTTDKLLQALNSWIEEQDRPELYKTWVIEKDSVPVFGDYHVGVPETPMAHGEMTVCPNPAADHLVIQGVEAALTQVFNPLGQLVKTRQNNNEISLEGLPKGLYLLRVTTKDGKTFADKVVKE